MTFKTEFKDNTIISIFISTVLLIILINILYPFSLNIWVTAILSFLAAFFLLNFIYSKTVAKGLSLHFVKDEIRHFQSQDGELQIVIKQDGWMPILNGELRVLAGDHILFKDEFLKDNRFQTETRVKFTVMGKNETLITLPYTANKRGIGKIVDVKIFAPQIFGFDDLRIDQKVRPNLEILIYPDKQKAQRDDMRSKMLQGFLSSNQALFDDPMMMVGVRDYEYLDSMKHIHWKATAKTGELKSKVYEKVTQMSWMFLVNLRSSDHYAPPEYIEDIFMKIAYLTEEATKEGIPYSIISNMKTFDQAHYFKIPESMGKKHYKNTLEALARINSMTYTIDYPYFLQDVLMHEKLPTHVIVCGHVDAESVNILKSFEHKGAYVYHLDTQGVHRFDIERGQFTR